MNDNKPFEVGDVVDIELGLKFDSVRGVIKSAETVIFEDGTTKAFFIVIPDSSEAIFFATPNSLTLVEGNTNV